MKNILLALILMVMPFNIDAGNRQDYWFCKAVGHVDGIPTIFLTKIWEDTYPNNYTLREEEFLKYLKKITSSKFRPSFDAKCRDYTAREKANKHKKREKEISNKYKFTVVLVDWRYTPDGRKEK